MPTLSVVHGTSFGELLPALHWQTVAVASVVQLMLGGADPPPAPLLLAELSFPPPIPLVAPAVIDASSLC
jgi:hypothetical protein